jgi:hypothetical protein
MSRVSERALARLSNRSRVIAALRHAREQLVRLEHYGAHIAGQNDRLAGQLERLERYGAHLAAQNDRLAMRLDGIGNQLGALGQDVATRLGGRHIGVLPLELVVALGRGLGIRNAVETGTAEGHGTALLARAFDRVTTIELSYDQHTLAADRLKGNESVTLLHGDSREILPAVVRASEPTLYWLDGHWMGQGGALGQDLQCPLLDELEALRGGHPDDCILIDDARFFIASPPPPFDADQWPSLVDVIDRLRDIRPQSHVTVVNDVVIAVPDTARAIVDAYAFGQLAGQGMESIADPAVVTENGGALEARTLH